MSKENAEKFYALYQQHQAFAKRLAEINAKSEDELLEGLAKLSKEVGLPATSEEVKGSIGSHTGAEVVGGYGWRAWEESGMAPDVLGKICKMTYLR